MFSSTVTLTTSYVSLGSSLTFATVHGATYRVRFAPTNTHTGYIEGDDGSDVPMSPGEWLVLNGAAARALKVKGTASEKVDVVECITAGNNSVVNIEGDLEIGAVELKNATDDTRVKVGVASSAAVSDNALYVADPNVKTATSTLKAATDIIVTSATLAKETGGNLANLAAAQGLFTVVGQGRQANASGSIAITLHASTVCKYFYFWLDDSASNIHFKQDGTNATATTNPAWYASQGAHLIILATPATSITLWGTGATGYINWVAGN